MNTKVDTEGFRDAPLRGVFWMFVTGLNFVAVTALVKYLGHRIPPAESAFLRYLLGLVFLIPMAGALRRVTLTPKLWLLFAGRGVVHSGGVMLWFFAMTQIPLAEVTAMNYLSPVYVTLGAALFLGEKLAARRIAAVVAALLGAVIILRPGFREISPGHIAMMFTALAFGTSYLLAKFTVDGTNPVVVVANVVDLGDAGAGAFCGRRLGHANPAGAGYSLCRCLLCDRRALHHDAGLCRSPLDGDAAGNLSPTDLGNTARSIGVL